MIDHEELLDMETATLEKSDAARQAIHDITTNLRPWVETILHEDDDKGSDEQQTLHCVD